MRKGNFEQKKEVFKALRFCMDIIDSETFDKVKFNGNTYNIQTQKAPIKFDLIQWVDYLKWNYTKENRPDFILKYDFDKKILTITCGGVVEIE
jgi:hypothetical protein